MNDRLIDALFSVSSRIKEIRMEMDKLAGDGLAQPMPTSHPDSAPLFARKEERATSRLSSGDTNSGHPGKVTRQGPDHLPLQCDVTMPGARLN